MLVKNIVEEDFVNYKLPSMFIATCFCDWKCCIEQNLDISICQNASISKQPNILISDSEIYKRYISNPITKAIVIGGLEPFRQYDDMYNLIELFRSNGCNDTFVIYTGYELYEEPLKSKFFLDSAFSSKRNPLVRVDKLIRIRIVKCIILLTKDNSSSFGRNTLYIN